jgi:hypothetical protein
MILHPNAAIRVLRNELERLGEARISLVEDANADRRRLEHREVNYMATLRIQARQASAALLLDQVDRESAELRDAIACIEAVFEYDQQQLPFDEVAA